MTLISDQDRAGISDAIRRAEAGTSGEIYIVVAHEVDDFRFVPVLWAALAALLIPWPLLFLTSWASSSILFAQAATFIGVALTLSHPSIRRRIVPAGVAADASRRMAQALFMSHGVHLTENRTGVLIYVALAHRRVEIVADAGINAKVDQSHWDALADGIAEAAKGGMLVKGLLAAINQAGSLLGQHCPPTASDRNELPDRVIELD